MSAELSVAIDRASPVPLYYQVAQQLEAAIEAGDLAAGARLDNEVLLADQLGVSRPTMRRAIEHWSIAATWSAGAASAPRSCTPRSGAPSELTSLFDDLTLSGKNPRTDVLRLDTEPAGDAIAAVLGIEPGDPVVVLERLRYAEGKPLAVMRWIPARPGGPRQGEPRAQRPVPPHAGLRCPPRLASQTIGALGHRRRGRAARRRQGRAAADHDTHHVRGSGQPVEHGDHFYLASRYSFEIALVTR